jgi:Flp pilus assembly protein TadG
MSILNALRNKRGNVAILTALSIPLVVGGAGFGVEVGYDYYEQVKVQQAADAAAYGGAVELRRGSADSAVTAMALTAAVQNGEISSTDTTTVNTPSSGAPANSVQATIARNEPRIFSAMFTKAPMVVVATATAQFASTASACVLALDPSASSAVNFSGNTSSTFTNCSVMSDSISSSSINVQGSAQAYVSCMYAVGGVTLTSGAHMTSCAAAQTGLGPVGDPFASLNTSMPSGPCQADPNGGAPSPGVLYCGLTFKNHVSLSPGTYYTSGSIFANANANVTGTGVTFVVQGGISLNGSAHFDISAPTTGSMAGMLFIGPKGSTSSVTINGDSSSSMTGNMYFPSASVSYLGNFTGTNGCMHIVADTVQWTGNTTVGINCSAYGMSNIPIGNVVLVG